MEEYADKYDLSVLKQCIREIKSVGYVINYIDSKYPKWIKNIYSNTCDKNIETIWNNTIEKMLHIKKQGIILIDFMYFDKSKYSNIIYFADILTQMGFLVIDKYRAIECTMHKKCIVELNNKVRNNPIHLKKIQN